MTAEQWGIVIEESKNDSFGRKKEIFGIKYEI